MRILSTFARLSVARIAPLSGLLLSLKTPEDSREAENGSKAHDLLEGLELVSRYDYLIARHKVDTIGGPTLVDLGDVHRNRREHSVRLSPQHYHFTLITRLQHTSCFGQGLGHSQAMIHQPDTWLADVTDDAITIRRRLIQRHGNLRIDDVLVVFLFDQFRNLVNRLPIDENAPLYERERNTTTRWHGNPGTRVSILIEDGNGNYVFGAKPVGGKEIIVIRNNGCFFRELLLPVSLCFLRHVGRPEPRVVWLQPFCRWRFGCRILRSLPGFFFVLASGRGRLLFGLLPIGRRLSHGPHERDHGQTQNSGSC